MSTIDPEDLEKAAPRPWNTLAIGAHASGGFHLYLIDANGRKIGCLWGKADEKVFTGSLITSAVNALEEPPIDASIEDIGAALRAIEEQV